jgi:membrane associated rhomboid family serine protease
MSYQMQIPPLTKINKTLIIISAAIFLIGSIGYAWLKIPMGIYLGLSLEGMMSGKIYQLLTYPFWQMGIFPLIFQCLILWWTGSELEYKWGTRFYLVFVASTIVVTAFLFLVVSLFLNATGIMQGSTMVGMSGLTLGLLFAYAMQFPDRQFSFFMLFPMKAKHFCLLLAAIEVYQVLFSPYGSSIWGHLLGGIWAIALLKYMSWKATGSKTIRKSKSQLQAEELRKSFKVITTDKDGKDGKNDGPKYWH